VPVTDHLPGEEATHTADDNHPLDDAVHLVRPVFRCERLLWLPLWLWWWGRLELWRRVAHDVTVARVSSGESQFVHPRTPCHFRP
jgi:hypothetical protein